MSIVRRIVSSHAVVQVQVQAELSSAAQEEIDLMSAVITGAAAGRRVNRPQLDQLERLTISFIRSHVGSITYFLGRDPLPLKEPLITGFLFDVDLIPQNVTTATSSK